MLVDLEFKVLTEEQLDELKNDDTIDDDFIEYFKSLHDPEKVQTGVYFAKGLNFGHYVSTKITSYPVSDHNDYLYKKHGNMEHCNWSVGDYGVADDVEQILEYYKDFINDEDNKYAISYCQISKSEEPSNGGWRWHKWGQYIGTKEPQCEYLYDEPEIDSVLIFHLHGVK